MKLIIETSGSTGSKKQVIVSEEACLAMAETDVADLGITRGSVVAIDSWSTAGWQRVFWARVSGCHLAVYPGAEKESMRQWLTHSEVTHLSTLASRFRWLASGMFTFPGVRVLEVGGEMVNWADVPLARERFPNAVFINRYACSEAKAVCRKRVLDGDTGQGRMPVGRPVKGVEVEIIDGPMGEIKVRSPYLASGYYEDVQLTHAKFKDGWYLTGDYGYFLPNGELMHCGRKDFQGRVRDKFNAVTDSERLDRNANTIIGSL